MAAHRDYNLDIETDQTVTTKMPKNIVLYTTNLTVNYYNHVKMPLYPLYTDNSSKGIKLINSFSKT